MRLYKIGITHYAPKDSKYAIKEYVVANNDEEVFNYLASGYAYWNDILEYAEDEYAQEKYDEIKNSHSDNREVSDLYYGATQYDWIEVDSDKELIDKMIEFKLAKIISNK